MNYETDNKEKKEVRRMTTQIAATPIIRGEEANRIWKEAKYIPDEEKMEKGERKLAEIFEKMMK